MPVYALIKDAKSEWIENFREGTTEQELKDIISNFNATLQPSERPRIFVKITDKPKSKIDEKIDLSIYVIGRKTFEGYIPLKIKDEFNEKYISFWIKRSYILQKKRDKKLKEVSKDEFKDNLFVCKLSKIFMSTEYCYIDSICKRCPMLACYSDTSNYFCRYKSGTDKRMNYEGR